MCSSSTTPANAASGAAPGSPPNARSMRRSGSFFARAAGACTRADGNAAAQSTAQQ